MANINTTTQTSTKKQTAVASSSTENIKVYQKIVIDVMSHYFPDMYKVTDSVYNVMATIGYESGWKLHFNNGSFSVGTEDYTYLSGTSSAHHTPSSSKSGGLIGNYWKTDPVQSVLRSGDVTKITAAHEGRVAHGLSATMGCYYYKGTLAQADLFKSPAIASMFAAEGLILSLQAGQRITTNLFLNDDAASWRKSIASGIGVYYQKWKWLLEHGYSEASAIQLASGLYVGGLRSKDGNNVSGLDRIFQVYNERGKVNQALTLAGITRAGVLDMSAIQQATRNTAQIAQNKQTSAPSGTSAASDVQKPVGCTA